MRNCTSCSDFYETPEDRIAEYNCEPCGDDFCLECIEDHFKEPHLTKIQTEKDPD
jgi:hypothetical protein